MILEVRLHDRAVGRLTNEAGSLAFSYDEQYLAGSAATPLSISLPLRAEPYSQADAIAFFGNLLPEVDVLEALSRVLQISPQNVGAFLQELGGDCAGAITLVEAGQPFESASPARKVDADELAELLDLLPERPLGKGTADGGLRMSLAGAQSKLPVIIEDGSYKLPVGSHSPTTHILKPEPARFPGLVANEWFCMRLAAAAGLETAAVEHGTTNSGLPYLIVERYDRDQTVVPVRRLHQEDCCQALGRAVRIKYEKEGGPSAIEILELMQSHSAVPARDRQRFWDALVFNFLIGNCDAHGKNYSLLYDSTAPRLAPLYDLVCTAAYPQLATQMAMKIGSARELDLIGWSDFEQLALEARMSPRWARLRTAGLVARVIDLAMPLADEAGGDLTREIATDLVSRAKRLTA